MHKLRSRVERLEHRLCHERACSGWCCIVLDPQDPDALPATCPHGGRWFIIEAVPPQSQCGPTDAARADPWAQYRAYSNGAEEAGDASHA